MPNKWAKYWAARKPERLKLFLADGSELQYSNLKTICGSRTRAEYRQTKIHNISSQMIDAVIDVRPLESFCSVTLILFKNGIFFQIHPDSNNIFSEI